MTPFDKLMTSQTILIIIGVLIVLLLVSRKTREPIVGICATAIGLDTKKRANKEKILELLRGSSASAQGSGETKEFSNADIREVLGISERSVVRYLDELEKEGRVEQVGATGRSVTYRMKQ